MYRTVDTSIWTDPKFKTLCVEEKLVFLYLITNNHAHVSGIYYLPRILVTLETGLSDTSYDMVCDTLSKRDIVCFDPVLDVVWVKNMLRYQGRGDKNHRSAAKQLTTLHNSPLIDAFLDFYPEVEQHCGDTIQDRVSRDDTAQETLSPEVDHA